MYFWDEAGSLVLDQIHNSEVFKTEIFTPSLENEKLPFFGVIY